jgi:uncharacterized membrane protein YfhO
MSLWIRRRDKSGKRHWWLIDTHPLLLVALWLISLVTVISYPKLSVKASLMIITIGAISLAVAKVSRFRQGIWISWGAGGMTQRNVKLYWTGYALMGGGLVLYLLARLVVT